MLISTSFIMVNEQIAEETDKYKKIDNLTIWKI